MAEGKASSPVRQILTLILSVTLVLYIGKIYLRTPEYRHIEVCYLPHKAAHLFWVDVWGALVPDDTASYLKHSRDLEEFFNSCVQRTAHWTWLRSFGPSNQGDNNG
ncbi:hypothetical protein JOY19_32965 (plasmid) [Pseudomonas aeruginosa]|jgi:hypothetical protein|uniref:Uncharacterized protein n=3 Tax=Pseudomonas TaxID=286 RepID=A0A1V0M6L6_PSEAI|nr:MULTISPECIES: hypothetical protein [Pseudomonas]WQN30354.1 hypothetical protein ULE26_22550 [Stutzerimonas stutzeri]AGL46417.1 hypothetical protein pOZ176_459 [Pseudomonas aeruginosa PA96]AJA17264.1 hypothetical protein RPPX_28490 [Pseudomonas putida S12]ARD70533.1 Hypothetical protein [Pseudomonas aeruginosa]EIU1445752.1 hypothetical protein [Pseudomonas aeruginosa]